MNSKLLLLSFLMSLSFLVNYAQTTATQTGIAIQGIARDSNNTALTNSTVSLSFELYYKDASSAEVTIGSIETINLTTDFFGIFSHVLNNTEVNNYKFSNFQAYLRIKKGTTLVSDEMLKHVPYAIAASNGVPTGSIMPFIGTVAPAGWALCDGNALPASATELIALIGTKTPDLRGMFLRGSGTNSSSTYATNVGPTLNTIQTDEFESHLHNQGTLVNSSDGSHTHTYSSGYTPLTNGVQGVAGGSHGDGQISRNSYTNTSSDEGSHTHTITGSTGSIGSTETRPVNYGVNHIIKF
jgi:microcystin-dependent protein